MKAEAIFSRTAVLAVTILLLPINETGFKCPLRKINHQFVDESWHYAYAAIIFTKST